MRHWCVYCVLSCGLAGLVGCGWQPGSKSSAAGGLAVVDLVEVANAVGANRRLDDMVQMKKKQLSNEWTKADASLKDQLKTLVDELKEDYPEEFPKNLPADEAKKLQQAGIATNANRQMLQNQAQVALQNFENQLKLQFRAEVRPIAQEIAAKKGFTVVIPKNDGLLLSVEPGNDITNDVILALQARNQKAATEAKPAATPATEAAAATPTNAVKPAKKKSDEKKTAEVPKEKSKSKEVQE